jgi:hypothetical protein
MASRNDIGRRVSSTFGQRDDARLRAGDWEVDGRWGPVELVKNNA